MNLVDEPHQFQVAGVTDDRLIVEALPGEIPGEVPGEVQQPALLA